MSRELTALVHLGTARHAHILSTLDTMHRLDVAAALLATVERISHEHSHLLIAIVGGLLSSSVTTYYQLRPLAIELQVH